MSCVALKFAVQVADACSILLFVCWPVTNFGADLVHVLIPVLPDAKSENLYSIIIRLIVKTTDSLVEIYLSFAFVFVLLAAVVVGSPFSFSAQLGWVETVKQYLDEAADICSIFFFVFILTVFRTMQLVFDGLIADRARIDAGAQLGLPDACRRVNSGSIHMAAFTAFACLIAAPLIVSMFAADHSAIHFFKNSLDEVADVCSIATVAIFIYYRARIRAFTAAFQEPNDASKKND